MKFIKYILLNLIFIAFLSSTISQTLVMVLNHTYTLASNLDKNNPKAESKQQKEASEEDENKEVFITHEIFQFRTFTSDFNFSIFNFKAQQMLLDQDIYPPEIYNV